MVEHAHRASGSGIAAAVSVVLLVVGASATFSSLNTALDIVFKVESPKGISGFALLLRARLISFGFVMGFGFLLVVSLVLDTAIQTVGHTVLGSITLTVVAAIAQMIFGILVMTAGFGALIKWLPDVHVRFRTALVGGAVAAVLFSVGRHLSGLYLAHAATAGSFGRRAPSRPHDVTIFLRRRVSHRRGSDRDTRAIAATEGARRSPAIARSDRVRLARPSQCKLRRLMALFH